MISEQLKSRDNKNLFTTNEITNQPSKLLGRKRIGLIKPTKIKPEIDTNGFRIGKWDALEHSQFLQACLKHGNNWPKVTISLTLDPGDN
jgi:hypothetical protein